MLIPSSNLNCMFDFSSHVNRLIKSENTLICICNILISAFLQLFRPSYGFNLSDPYCRLLETQYKSLHDPHLRTYYKRKDILRRLKKGGYITSNNKVSWRLLALVFFFNQRDVIPFCVYFSTLMKGSLLMQKHSSHLKKNEK